MKGQRESLATILVVDDDRSNLDLILGILTDYDVIPSTSGEDALDVLRSDQVDLVIMDIVMPGKDGFQTCREMKSDPLTAELPVIFITAEDSEESIEHAYAAGGYDYISKPIHAVELLARVNTQLQLSHQYRELQQQNKAIDQARKALALSEERYRLAMDAVTHGLWDWNIQTGEVYFSPAWKRILGERELGESYETWSSRIHPDDRKRVLGSLEEHLLNPRSEWAQEHRLKHANGSWSWVLGTGRVVEMNAAGRPTRMVGTMIDIGERKCHQALLELRHQLSEMVYTDTVEHLVQTALTSAEQLTGSQVSFCLFLEDKDAVALQIWSPATLNDPAHTDHSAKHEPINRAGIWADAVRQARTVIHNDYPNAASANGTPACHIPLRRDLITPVIREGHVTAVMGLGNKTRPYEDTDIEIADQIAEMAQDMVIRKRMEQRIERMAFYDSLTGLPNRALMEDRLHQAIAASQRSGHSLAVCLFDLDGFKPVNDQFGHHAGDQLLIALAKRLNTILRDGDTFARLGGDEFILLLNELATTEDAIAIVERTLRTIEQPFQLQGEDVRISASFGVTIYPTDQADEGTLLRHADQAMYEAKDAGKNTYRIYRPK